MFNDDIMVFIQYEIMHVFEPLSFYQEVPVQFQRTLKASSPNNTYDGSEKVVVIIKRACRYNDYKCVLFNLKKDRVENDTACDADSGQCLLVKTRLDGS